VPSVSVAAPQMGFMPRDTAYLQSFGQVQPPLPYGQSPQYAQPSASLYPNVRQSAVFSGGMGQPYDPYTQLPTMDRSRPYYAAPSPYDLGGQVAFARDGKPSKVECRHWARGNCSLNNNCNFKHSDPNTSVPAGVEQRRSPAICRNWAKGYCSLAQGQCKFLHANAPGTGFGEAPERKSATVCRHFLKGFCERGSACGFSHEAGNGGVSARTDDTSMAQTHGDQRQPELETYTGYSNYPEGDQQNPQV